MNTSELTIRRLIHADIAAIDQVLIRAFNRPESRAAELERYLRIQPDGWFIALLQDVPVGMVGAVKYDSFAYIGLMGVHPAYQGLGLGRALMTHLLAWLDDQQVPASLLDATDKGYPLYASLGFVLHDTARVFVQNELLRLIPPPPAWIYALEPSHLDELAVFDGRVFGADRRRVFEEFLQGGSPAFLARRPDGALSGYVIAQGGRLGPWVAQDVQAAEGLLQAVLPALQTVREGPAATSLPGANPDAEGLLSRYGFHSPRHLRHMRRGQVSTLEHRDWVYGQASFAIG